MGLEWRLQSRIAIQHFTDLMQFCLTAYRLRGNTWNAIFELSDANLHTAKIPFQRWFRIASGIPRSACLSTLILVFCRRCRKTPLRSRMSQKRQIRFRSGNVRMWLRFERQMPLICPTNFRNQYLRVMSGNLWPRTYEHQASISV